jgi:hypothetical protein
MSYGFGVSDWEHASQDVAFQRDLALRDAPKWVLDSIREQRMLPSEETEEAPPKRRRRYY